MVSFLLFLFQWKERACKKTCTKEFASKRLKTAIVHDLRLHRNVSVTSYSCNTYSPVVKIVFSHSIHTVNLLYYFALEKKNVRILRSFSIICFDSIKIEWERKITKKAAEQSSLNLAGSIQCNVGEECKEKCACVKCKRKPVEIGEETKQWQQQRLRCHRVQIKSEKWERTKWTI